MQEALTFKIEDFEGPLDMLLYLVGKNKMNLYDINLMTLIDQYTEAIRTCSRIVWRLPASSLIWRRILSR